MAPDVYLDIIQEHGDQNKMDADNDQVLTDNRYTNINRKYCIATSLTVPHHQHQKYCEGQGGYFKFSLQKLFHNAPHAPIVYWYYAAMFLYKTRRYLSNASLDGKYGNEMITVETSNISIFRFY